MYENEKESFGKLLQDLCKSVNRPFDADLARVFWEDLKHVPYPNIERQAMQLRTTGKKNFSSNDLRPPPEERAALGGPDNHALLAKLDRAFVRLWDRMSDNQRSLAQFQEYIWTNDRIAPRPVALIIKADRQVLMIDGVEQVREYPGHRIRVIDCDLDEAFDLPPRAVAQREPGSDDDFNEADAARALLNCTGTPDLLQP